MSLLRTMMSSPGPLQAPSRYTVFNGYFYMGFGGLGLAWPGAAQTLFLEAPFVGHEAGMMRLVGMTLMIIGWLYVFGGRTGAQSAVAATVVDRLLVPFAAVPLVLMGVLPHLLSVFAVLDPLLAVGAWLLLRKAAKP